MIGTLPEQTVEEAIAWAERGTAPLIALDFGSDHEAIWVVLARRGADTILVPATGKHYTREQIPTHLRPALETATALDVRFRQRIPDDLTRLHLWLLMIGADNLRLTLDDGITVWKALGTDGGVYVATRGDERTGEHRTPHEAVEDILAFGAE